MTVKNENEYGKPSLSGRSDLRLVWTRLSCSLVMRDKKDCTFCMFLIIHPLHYFQCR